MIANSFGYTYNLAGDLRNEVYPSGRSIWKDYDGAGRESYVFGDASGGGRTTYAISGGYWPHGALQYAVYGNQVYPTYTYNNRLQMSGAYAIANGDGNRYFTNWTLDWGGSTNNGTLRAKSEAYGNQVPGWQLNYFNQNYTYDNLNRLASAGDTGWSRNYSYDGVGNRWLTYNSGVPLQGNTPTTSYTYNSNNQSMGGVMMRPGIKLMSTATR